MFRKTLCSFEPKRSFFGGFFTRSAANASSSVAAGGSGVPSVFGSKNGGHNLDVLETVCRERYSCKNFDETKSINVKELERILDIVVRAPTGFNLQGWHAIVIGDNNLKNALPLTSPFALPENYLKTSVPRNASKSAGSASAVSEFQEKQLDEAKVKKDLLFKASLGQMQVMQSAFTIVFAGDTEPERNAPAAAEMGNSTVSPTNENVKYYGDSYFPIYLRNVYYTLHTGPCHSMSAAKRVLSHFYSNYYRNPTSYLRGSSYTSAGSRNLLKDYTPLLTTPLTNVSYAWKQTIFPVSQFVLCATANNWQTCVMEGIDEEAIKRVCGLPDRFTIPVIVSVGIADADHFMTKNRAPSPRFATSHMVRWGNY